MVQSQKQHEGSNLCCEEQTGTFNRSRKPLSSTSSGLISKSLATQTAAVLRTYGSSSCTVSLMTSPVRVSFPRHG